MGKIAEQNLIRIVCFQNLNDSAAKLERKRLSDWNRFTEQQRKPNSRMANESSDATTDKVKNSCNSCCCYIIDNRFFLLSNECNHKTMRCELQ